MSTPPSPLNDDIVRAARDGDRQMQSLVVASLANAVRIMVLVRLTPSAMRVQDVDDIVQESLTAISNGLTTLRDATLSALRGFASTIVSRNVANYLAGDQRRAGRRPVSLEQEIGDGSAAGALRELLSASGFSPGTVAARREQIRHLLVQLAAMKETHREVITMAVIDQVPMTEIAERMGLTRPAASMLLYRAMRTLRRNVTGSSELGNDDVGGA